MREVSVTNLSRGTVLARRALLADTPDARRRGLLGTPCLPDGRGLLIVPCRQVHTFGMRYAIDVVFLGGDWKVRRVVRAMQPWRLGALVLGGRAAVELPAGKAAETGTRVGDTLQAFTLPGDEGSDCAAARATPIIGGKGAKGVGMCTTERHIRRYRRGGEALEAADRIVLEVPLEVRVNGIPLAALMRMPGMEEELATGFCLSEGVIPEASRIKSLRLCLAGEGESGGGGLEGAAAERVDAVELDIDSPCGGGRSTSFRVVRSGGGGADISALEGLPRGKASSRPRVREEVFYHLGEELTRRQGIFRGTGGTHGAGVFSPAGEAVMVAEDVGRHNALDKAVGWCALRGISLEDKLLVLSGRVSCEMALKAARAGIPLLVSLAAPTALGLLVAERAGLTVVGFCDGKRFNAYTGLERIEA